MSTQFESIQLSLEQKRQIAETADQVGRPWPEVLEKALDSYKTRLVRRTMESSGKSFLDVMKESGVVGILEDGPPDLSTNPKYLEDLGRD